MAKLFKSKNPHFELLHKKWSARNVDSWLNLQSNHLKSIAIGGLGSLALLSTPTPLPLPSAHLLGPVGNLTQVFASTSKNILLATELIDKLPKEVRALTPDEEKDVISLIYKNLKLKVVAEIDGKRLNRSFGLIGGEQHLYRYPGDTLFNHLKSASDWVMFAPSGIAPGLGAWGYFAPSKQEFTREDEARERYYIAVQTFLSSGFAERVEEYRDFYKYRKMLLVNPTTGQAIVANIADAGPASWTGKHLGGSPEVMHELGLAEGPRKGAVLYFFIDPGFDYTLGPIRVGEAQS